MTYVDMVREARAIVPPAGATKAIATHDGTGYRAAFLIDNRRHSVPAGPTFTKPRAVCTFVDILNGDTPASRPGSDDFAGAGASSSEDARIQPETPLAHHPAPPGSDRRVSVLDPAAVASPSAAGVRTCAGCGGPLPPGRRGQRRLTCSPACRVAASRRHGADDDEGDGDSGSESVTPSRPSPAEVLAAHRLDVIRACNPDAPAPTSRVAADARALPAATQDAGADPYLESSDPDALSLGML